MASKDKIAALVHDVPGAPRVWHTVEGVNGLVHPDIPVPHLNAEEFVKAHAERLKQARKAWDKREKEAEAAHLKPGANHGPLRGHGRLPFIDPPCPVKLVWVTEKQAREGLEAHDAVTRVANAQLRTARRSEDKVERTLAHNEAAALSGGEKE